MQIHEKKLNNGSEQHKYLNKILANVNDNGFCLFPTHGAHMLLHGPAQAGSYTTKHVILTAFTIGAREQKDEGTGKSYSTKDEYGIFHGCTREILNPYTHRTLVNNYNDAYM